MTKALLTFFALTAVFWLVDFIEPFVGFFENALSKPQAKKLNPPPKARD